jgi:hypothetical protein
VQDCVAVRTHRPQVCIGVNAVLLANLRKRPHVVDVNEVLSDRSVGGSEREAADHTSGSLPFDAQAARFGISLVRIYRNLISDAFEQGIWTAEFVRQRLDDEARPHRAEQPLRTPSIVPIIRGLKFSKNVGTLAFRPVRVWQKLHRPKFREVVIKS